MEDPFVTTGFASVTKGAASQEDWRAGFASVTEGAASQEDWSATVVADPYGRQRYFLVMEDGMPPSLRGSVDAFVASGGIPTRGHGVRHVGIFVGTRLHLSFQ
jgi:hypothetical protein